MERLCGSLELGTLICKHCGNIIGTLDTRKVTIIYTVCMEAQCAGRHEQKKGEAFHASEGAQNNA